MIDVGQAFAPGQVYVALSRLTSLDEGLILRTKIDPNVVSTDQLVVAFAKTKEDQQLLQTILEQDQTNFLSRMLGATFDFSDVIKAIEAILKKHETVGQFEDEEMRSALAVIAANVSKELANTQKFVQQLRFCLQENDHARLLARIEKGSQYYINFVEGNLKILLKHIEEVKQFSKTKTYRDALAEIDLILMKNWEQMDKARDVADAIINGKEIKKNLERDTNGTYSEESLHRMLKKKPRKTRRTPRRKRAKDERRKTLAHQNLKRVQPSKSLMTLPKTGFQLLKLRRSEAFTTSTIEGHIAKGIQAGELKIDAFMDEDDRDTIVMTIKDNPEGNSGTIYGKLKGNSAMVKSGWCKLIWQRINPTFQLRVALPKFQKRSLFC